MQDNGCASTRLANHRLPWASDSLQRAYDLPVCAGDFHSVKGRQAPLTRSEVMARVKSKDTKPEMRLRSALHAAGLRYRLQAGELPGQPDVVFRRARLAIFVHGCFWHRHAGCEHARMPKSRLEFWQEKLQANVERDFRQLEKLKAAEWTVMTLWECETRDQKAIENFVNAVTQRVRDGPRSALLLK